MKKRHLFFLFVSFFLSGCLFQENPEELDRLTKEDPAFKQIIQARDQAHDQIRLIKENLLSKKQTMDAEAEKLRAGYDAYAKAQNKKIDQFRGTIEANRNLLKQQLEQQSASMQGKQEEVAGYEKSLAAVRRVLQGGKGLSLSKTERQKWEERVLMLSEKIRPLVDEIQELKLQVRLKKQKIQFLN